MVSYNTVFHTPMSWSELLDFVSYIQSRDKDNQFLLAAKWGYNIVIAELNDKSSENSNSEKQYIQPLPKIPYSKTWGELMTWLDGQPREDRARLTSTAWRGYNLAVYQHETGILQEQAAEFSDRIYCSESDENQKVLSNEVVENSTSEIGYIYILARKSGKIVKVGETSRDPSKRHKEYVAEYKLRDFELFRTFEVPLNARKDIEKLAHQKLQHLRLSLLEQGGAREIFECDTATAVKAIEEAKAESEINRIEEEKQRQQQIKRDKLAKAQAKYDEQLEKFIEGWLREWEGSHWVKSKRSVLAKFVTETPFEKEGQRTISDYFVLLLGWYFLIIGILAILGGIRSIVDPIPENGLGTSLLILTFGGAAIWFGKAWISYPITLVPDEEALAKKAAMEEEIETNKQTTIATARNDFEKHFTLENFYE